MKFNITDPIEKEGVPNTFSVELNWMHGVGDAYTTTKSKFFKLNESEWALEELLLTLDAVLELDTDEYYAHMGFRKWFDLDNYDFTVEEFEKYFPYVKIEIEYDNYTGYRAANLLGYEVYYYDESLNKYLVEVDYN